MRWRCLPNLLTALRLLLAPWILYGLWIEAYAQAAGWLLIALFSDLLDGYLARRFRWQSELGGLLDPIADKLLMTCCFVGLALSDHVPTWLLLCVVLRDLVIVGGAVSYRALIGPFAAEPRWLGKFSTLVQSIFLLATVLALGWRWPLSPWLDLAVWTVALVAVVSGVDYVWHWSRRAWRAKRSSRLNTDVTRGSGE